MRTKAIYAGSFDPLTKGHLDIINRAAQVFDTVIVLVANNPSKKYTFNLEQRTKFLARNVDLLPNVQVESMEHGLTADYAYRRGVKVMVKGVRNAQDFDYERLLHEISISQQKGIDTHILVARKELNNVSSTAAKELCRHQGLLDEYVTLDVKEALEKSINKQFILGVTGVIGAGKSYISNEIQKTFNDSITGGVHNIELDHLAHSILFSRKDDAFIELQEQLIAEFGLTELTRKTLGDAVFSDEKKLARLNELMKNPMQTCVREAMAGKSGLMVLNGALLVEAGYLDMCNNNIVLVRTSGEKTAERLKGRGMTDMQILRRLASQYSSEVKEQKIREKINRDKWGNLTIIDNDGKTRINLWDVLKPYLLKSELKP